MQTAAWWSPPFEQQLLNKNLERMLQYKGQAKWRDNGIAFGRQQDLYSLPERSAAIISKFAGRARAGK